VNFIEASIFILLIAILFVPLATRFRLPLEIFLFLGSCIISLMPGLPVINISPIVVFDLFLPPILFSAAYFTSWRDFKFNLRPISQLAIGLVIFTTLTVALAVKYLLPDFTWSEAFLFGAIVSPTDASAATSIVKKLGVPRRFIVLLEGESLVNDATALILYRFSLAAILFGAFSMSQAVIQFFSMAIGGAAIGLLTAIFAEKVLQQLKDFKAETTFTVVTAYMTYLLAEHLGFSSVISTVVGGMYFGIRFPEIASSKTNVSAKASWGTLMFVINGFVFTLIGFELPIVIKNLGNYSIFSLVCYGLAISAVVIGVRMIWLFPSAYIPRLLFPSIARKDPMPPWEFLAAFGWAGMRGILSLAAVLAIPHTLPSGAPFPNQDILIFLTYCVIVTTLITPAIILPPLIKWLRLTEVDDRVREEANARIRAFEEVIKSIEQIKMKEKIPDKVVTEFCDQVQRKLKVIRTQLEETPYSMLYDDYFALKKLTIRALEAERKTLLKLRRSGEIRDEIFHNLLDELDIEEVRARSLRV